MKAFDGRAEKAGQKSLREANGARDRREWAQAARLYRAYVDHNPEDAAIWVQLGNCLKESGDLVRAEAAYLRSLSIAPDLADTHVQFGHVEKLSGRLDAALQRYRRALDLDPTLESAREEIERLAPSSAAASPQNSGAAGPASDLAARMTAAETKLTQITAQMRPLDEQATIIRALTSEAARLRQRIEALEGQVAALQGEIANAEASSQDERRALSDRLARLEAQSPPVRRQFSALLEYFERINSHDGRLAEHGEAIAALAGRNGARGERS